MNPNHRGMNSPLRIFLRAQSDRLVSPHLSSRAFLQYISLVKTMARKNMSVHKLQHLRPHIYIVRKSPRRQFRARLEITPRIQISFPKTVSKYWRRRLNDTWLKQSIVTMAIKRHIRNCILFVRRITNCEKKLAADGEMVYSENVIFYLFHSTAALMNARLVRPFPRLTSFGTWATDLHRHVRSGFRSAIRVPPCRAHLEFFKRTLRMPVISWQPHTVA